MGVVDSIDPLFRLSLAGSFELEGPEGPIVLPGKKLVGLLMVLSLHAPDAVSREKLATLLWGSHFEQQAKQNLRQALFRLRSLLGHEAIVASESTVRLRPGVIDCDVTRIRELIGEGSRTALVEAVALYRGPLFADLAISEEAWCDWLEHQRREFEDLVQDAMLEFAELALTDHDHHQALIMANRVLAMNNLREDAHRLVMRALTASGRRADALKHYDALARLLKAELGAAPDPITMKLAAELLSPPTEAANVETDPAPAAAPNRATIAVLPFANLSGDPKQEYLGEGIADDIITELSRFSNLLVIARNSSFRYKSQGTDVRKVSAELGVRYLLEGSVRQAGERIRITAQLVDAVRGTHLWAEHFDRPFTEIFEIQDETIRSIVAALAAYLNKAETERISLTPPADWRAYHYYMRARQSYAAYFATAKVEILYQSRELLERALQADPHYARAQTMLADSFVTTAVNPLDGDYMKQSVLDRAQDLALAALNNDPALPESYIVLGRTLVWKREHGAALAAFERGSALNPNLADWRFASCLYFSGEPLRALEAAKAYMRMDPFYLPSAQMYLGLSLFLLRRFDEALIPALEVSSRLRNFVPVHANLAAIYTRCGRPDEARAQAAEVLRLNPNYSMATHRQHQPYRLKEHAELYFGSLREAGLPDN